MKYFALLGVLALAVACGSKNEAGTFVAPDGGSSGASATGGRTSHGGSGGVTGHAGAAGTPVGGSAGTGDTGNGGEAGADNTNLSPIVTITSPADVSDPNVGPVVLNTVHVVCDVTKGNGANATIATNTVSIEAFDATGKSIKRTLGTQSVGNETEFTADFILTGVASGAVSFECSAGDMSTPPHMGTATVNALLDQGPTITLKTPKIGDPVTYYPLNSPLLVEFNVDPAPLTDTDTQSVVDTVTLKVDSVVIDLKNAGVLGSPGAYSLNVLLSDLTTFPKQPDGPVAIEITATNKRVHPAPVANKVLGDFGVDGTGPIIKIVSPDAIDATVLGKHVTLQFTVVDAQSMVDTSSVTVTFNKTDVRHFDLTSGKGWSPPIGDTFSYLLDTTTVPGSQIQLHVEVTANDLVNNASDVKNIAAADYWLDTTVPTLDLDPHNIQDRKISATGTGTDYFCSDRFDPLGASPNDKEIVPSTRNYRALVWDETNTSDGQNVFHFSGIDPSTVELYAQADLTQPLLEDSDGDGICDSLLVDSTDGITSLPVAENLTSLPSAGHPFYEASSPTIANVCTADAEPEPDFLCSAKNSDMTRVIDHNISNRTAAENVIYTLTSNDPLECTGKGLEISSSIAQNGWVCLAAQAFDFAGNRGISAPLRVCLNSAGPGRTAPSCATAFTIDAQGREISTETPPSCVKANCKLPKRFPYTVLNQVEN